jgi:hypothetical protein
LPAFRSPIRKAIEHAVEVAPASLYEAAVLALAEFLRCGFADATFGQATRLNVRVKTPEEEPTVMVCKVRSWLEGARRVLMRRLRRSG